jgi:hypothetical protein
LENLKNLFYAGNYQAVAESPLASSNIEAKVLHLQSLLAQGNAKQVLSQLSNTQVRPLELQALKLLAQQQLSTASDESVFELEKLLKESNGKNGLVASLAALFYIRQGLLQDALRALAPFQNQHDSSAFIEWYSYLYS